MLVRRRMACGTWGKETRIDFDEHDERIMTYNGLGSCILNSQSFENESGMSRGGDGCLTDSMDEDDSSSCSSNNVFGSFSSHWASMNKDVEREDECPQNYHIIEKPAYPFQISDVEAMKVKFSKILLGEDITGGSKGLHTALALSNAITNLAASVFGELWKLEPLPEERKSRWRREMDWLLSPTSYMVELVPAKQTGADGQTLEIMTPKARPDVDMNLPALQKLDSMLIETLDSMVHTEFWYAEGGSRGEGRSRSARQSRRWWLPLPQVPTAGLSDNERRKLVNYGKLVHQVFKATKSINENVLLEMPVPAIIGDALPKSGKASLGEELYRILAAESYSTEEMLNSLNLNSENCVLDIANRLEAAVFAWKERIVEQLSGRSPALTSWSSFIMDSISEQGKIELLLDRAEILLQQLKARYPNLPQTFLDVSKIQYGMDVGHSILEAYSRVLGNLAFSILARIGDILQEDLLRNPNSPVPMVYSPGLDLTRISQNTAVSAGSHSLIDQMNGLGDKTFCPNGNNIVNSDSDIQWRSSFRTSSAAAIASRGARVWCIGREVCSSVSPQDSP